MPKEFSEWMGSMLNSIEDASTINKNYIGDELTSFQIRMSIADLLVPSIKHEWDVQDWLGVFSVGLDCGSRGNRSVVEQALSTIIGPNNTREYCDSEDGEGTIEWLNKLKTKIKNNILTSN